THSLTGLPGKAPPSGASLGGVQVAARAGSAAKPRARRSFLKDAATLTAGAAVAAGATLAARRFGLIGDHKPFTFGMSAAFSGPAKDLGRGMRVGIEARLQQANSAGETSRPL